MKRKKPLLPLLSASRIMVSQPCRPCGETPKSGNQKIARVVVLLGQSNMEGYSHTTFLREKGVSQEKYEEYRAGFETVKISYFSPRNPSQTSEQRFVPTALSQGGDENSFGPEVGIAEYLSEKGYRSVFLVKYSYGGTSLCENWRPPSSGGRTGELYTGAVEYVINAMKALKAMGFLPVIDAVCWMQGESDADKTQDIAEQYCGLLSDFIADLRKALSEYANKDGIGFIDAGISDCAIWTYYKQVNDAKYTVAVSDELNTYFSTIDEKLEYMDEPTYGADIAHYDCVSEIKLGRLFGQSLEKYLDRKI